MGERNGFGSIWSISAPLLSPYRLLFTIPGWFRNIYFCSSGIWTSNILQSQKQIGSDPVICLNNLEVSYKFCRCQDLDSPWALHNLLCSPIFIFGFFSFIQQMLKYACLSKPYISQVGEAEKRGTVGILEACGPVAGLRQVHCRAGRMWQGSRELDNENKLIPSLPMS